MTLETTVETPAAAARPQRSRSTTREAAQWACGLGACVAMAIAAYYFQPDNMGAVAVLGLYVVPVGLLLLGLALWLSGDVALPLPAAVRAPLRFNRRALAGGLLLLALLLQINVLSTQYDDIPLLAALRQTSHYLQFLLFVAGMALLAWGLSGTRLSMAALGDWRPRAHHLPLLSIVLLALLLRVWNLEHSIHRLVDEIHFVDAVVRLRWSSSEQLLLPFGGITAFSWIFPYGQYLLLELMGTGLAGLRMLSALMGAAHVPALYFLALQFFGRRTALLAALLLATFPPHLQFSRLGLNNIGDPLFGILALAFLARGLRQGRQADFALAGVMLGLTHYFYEGGRLFYTPFVLSWLVWALVLGRSGVDYLRPRATHLLTLGGGLLLVAGLLYYSWAGADKSFMPRLDAVGRDNSFLFNILHEPIETLSRLWHNLTGPVLGYVYLPETSDYYSAGTAFVLPLLVPVFLLAVGICVWRLQRPGYALLFWWVLGTSVGNSFIGDSLSAPRYVVVFPALALLLAVGFTHIPGLLLRRAGWLHGAMLGLGLLAALYQGVYYYGVHLPRYYYDAFYNEYDVRGVWSRDFDDMLFRAVRLPPETQVHVVSRALYGHIGWSGVLLFYDRGDIRLTHVYPEEFERYIGRLSPLYHHAFFIEPDDGPGYRAIQQHFITGGPQLSPYNVPPEKQLVLYFADRDQNISAGGQR